MKNIKIEEVGDIEPDRSDMNNFLTPATRSVLENVELLFEVSRLRSKIKLQGQRPSQSTDLTQKSTVELKLVTNSNIIFIINQKPF